MVGPEDAAYQAALVVLGDEPGGDAPHQPDVALWVDAVTTHGLPEPRIEVLDDVVVRVGKSHAHVLVHPEPGSVEWSLDQDRGRGLDPIPPNCGQLRRLRQMGKPRELIRTG